MPQEGEIQQHSAWQSEGYESSVRQEASEINKNCAKCAYMKEIITE